MSHIKTVVDTVGQPGPRSPSLLILGQDGGSTVPLPLRGAIIIGRADSAQVSLGDPLASRRHARLAVSERGFELEDLGSANGTRVQGVTLDPHRPTLLAPGTVISIGSTLLIVQEIALAQRPRRVWPHSYFEARLEEECARARETRRTPFGVLRLHVDGAMNGVHLADVIASTCPLAVLGLYGPGEYELLLSATTAEMAAVIAHDLELQMKARGLDVRTGLACYPSDGQVPEELLGVACGRVRTRGGSGVSPFDGKVVVLDPAMRQLFQVVERVAIGTISVLIAGETGTGKELVAEALHRGSNRHGATFLRFNCAAFAETLLENELFGHERDAFTGAGKEKPGLLEMAPGGTIFLDEIGEMPLSLQAKLLRVIEERAVMRVGGVKTRPIDVRFIAATNRDLRGEVEAGRFRRDLYFRLNGIALCVPPLRERLSEIIPLSKMFLVQFSAQMSRPIPRLDQAAADLLVRHTWPGNIRELRNVIERAVLLCGPEVTAEHLPLEVVEAPSLAMLRPPGAPSSPRSTAGLPPQAESERERIVRLLGETGGNQTHVARTLGIARSTLISKLQQYQIPRPRPRKSRETPLAPSPDAPRALDEGRSRSRRSSQPAGERAGGPGRV